MNNNEEPKDPPKSEMMHFTADDVKREKRWKIVCLGIVLIGVITFLVCLGVSIHLHR